MQDRLAGRLTRTSLPELASLGRVGGCGRDGPNKAGQIGGRLLVENPVRSRPMETRSNKVSPGPRVESLQVRAGRGKQNQRSLRSLINVKGSQVQILSARPRNRL